MSQPQPVLYPQKERNFHYFSFQAMEGGLPPPQPDAPNLKPLSQSSLRLLPLVSPHKPNISGTLGESRRKPTPPCQSRVF